MSCAHKTSTVRIEEKFMLLCSTLAADAPARFAHQIFTMVQGARHPTELRRDQRQAWQPQQESRHQRRQGQQKTQHHKQ